MEKIYTPCSQCGSTGIEVISTLINDELVNEEITCRTCNGAGKISNLSLDNDLIDLFVDMNDKINDIIEKVKEL
jgi:hypothetical protein